MSNALVQRARQIISAEGDDFFKADQILYYLNRAQIKVTSYMVNQERQQKTSLRALDGLRNLNDITLTSGTQRSDYFEVDVDFPTDLNDFQYLRYNDATILKELSTYQIYELDWGNVVPSQYEGYYQIVNSSGTKKFRLFLHEDPNGTTDKLNLHYIKNPTELELTSTGLTELPPQLENAVIYGAGIQMIGQESVKDPDGNVRVISEIYQEELKSNIY